MPFCWFCHEVALFVKLLWKSSNMCSLAASVLTNDYSTGQFEPTHEIMALIALRKLNLQTYMRRIPMGLYVWFFGRSFVYFYTLCVRIAKALARLCRCAVSPEPSLFAYAISTIISWAGSFGILWVHKQLESSFQVCWDADCTGVSKQFKCLKRTVSHGVYIPNRTSPNICPVEYVPQNTTLKLVLKYIE